MRNCKSPVSFNSIQDSYSKANRRIKPIFPSSCIADLKILQTNILYTLKKSPEMCFYLYSESPTLSIDFNRVLLSKLIKYNHINSYYSFSLFKKLFIARFIDEQIILKCWKWISGMDGAKYSKYLILFLCSTKDIEMSADLKIEIVKTTVRKNIVWLIDEVSLVYLSKFVHSNLLYFINGNIFDEKFLVRNSLKILKNQKSNVLLESLKIIKSKSNILNIIRNFQNKDVIVQFLNTFQNDPFLCFDILASLPFLIVSQILNENENQHLEVVFRFYIRKLDINRLVEFLDYCPDIDRETRFQVILKMIDNGNYSAKYANHLKIESKSPEIINNCNLKHFYYKYLLIEFSESHSQEINNWKYETLRSLIHEYFSTLQIGLLEDMKVIDQYGEMFACDYKIINFVEGYKKDNGANINEIFKKGDQFFIYSSLTLKHLIFSKISHEKIFGILQVCKIKKAISGYLVKELAETLGHSCITLSKSLLGNETIVCMLYKILPADNLCSPAIAKHLQVHGYHGKVVELLSPLSRVAIYDDILLDSYLELGNTEQCKSIIKDRVGFKALKDYFNVYRLFKLENSLDEMDLKLLVTKYDLKNIPVELLIHLSEDISIDSKLYKSNIGFILDNLVKGREPKKGFNDIVINVLTKCIEKGWDDDRLASLIKDICIHYKYFTDCNLLAKIIETITLRQADNTFENRYCFESLEMLYQHIHLNFSRFKNSAVKSVGLWQVLLLLTYSCIRSSNYGLAYNCFRLITRAKYSMPAEYFLELILGVLSHHDHYKAIEIYSFFKAAFPLNPSAYNSSLEYNIQKDNYTEVLNCFVSSSLDAFDFESAIEKIKELQSYGLSIYQNNWIRLINFLIVNYRFSEAKKYYESIFNDSFELKLLKFFGRKVGNVIWSKFNLF